MKMNENEMEERLKQLPEIAGEMDVHADEKLKYRILRAAEEKRPEPKTKPIARVLALACAAVVVLGAVTIYSIGNTKKIRQ